jgi:hypothetical protein
MRSVTRRADRRPSQATSAAPNSVGGRHLRHVLLSYMSYYNGNGTRTHLSLNKDAPMSRVAETAGRISCRPILGGLHHQYARV